MKTYHTHLQKRVHLDLPACRRGHRIKPLFALSAHGWTRRTQNRQRRCKVGGLPPPQSKGQAPFVPSQGAGGPASVSDEPIRAGAPPVLRELPAARNPTCTPVEEENDDRPGTEIPLADLAILSLAVAIGLLTGLGVVLFNTGVHAIQDEIVWTSAPKLAAFGTAGLSHDPDYVGWRCLLLPPILAGALVAGLRALVGGFGSDVRSVARAPDPLPSTPPRQYGHGRVASDAVPRGQNTPLRVPAAPAWSDRPCGSFGQPRAISMPWLLSLSRSEHVEQLQSVARPYVKLLAAVVTLGSGASLGPEGPAVELGKANARNLRQWVGAKAAVPAIDLLAAGAGAGVAAGFGAPMSGVIFAVETVLLRPPPPMGAPPLTAPSATPAAPSLPQEDESGVLMATVLVACVCAAVASQAGLGGEPAFHVPDIVAFTVAEVPLCVVLGVLAGGAATCLAAAARSAEASFARLRAAGVPRAALPVLGGAATGSLALLWPEVSYQGFDNLNALLQLSDRTAGVYTPAALAILVAAKVAATAICRGSGLVGGVYAPSLFIGAALGEAFWMVTSDIAGATSATSALSASQMYGLVGAAAMLAAHCRVPLTAVLLLFELTQDYTILLPTLASVGIARWSAATADRILLARH